MMETEVIDHVNAAGDRCRTYIDREHGKVIDAYTHVVGPRFPSFAFVSYGCNRRTAARDRRAPMFYKDVASTLTALEELPDSLKSDCVFDAMKWLASHLRKASSGGLRTYERRKCDR